jgi:hypothetical protein
MPFTATNYLLQPLTIIYLLSAIAPIFLIKITMILLYPKTNNLKNASASLNMPGIRMETEKRTK